MLSDEAPEVGGSFEMSLEGFAVTFPSFRFKPLDLSVEPGARVALLGANGAGKSTLMRALAGAFTGYEGAIRVRDAELRELLPHYRQSVGFLPEKVLGTPDLTVAERLTLLAGFRPSWDAAYAKDLLERLDLPGDAIVGTLSKGMALKLSFVSAEAHRPNILILDEPTAGLDPVVRRTFLSILQEVLESGPLRTLIFSTHILEDVEAFADRVWVLRSGVLTTNISISKLKEREGSGNLLALLHEEIDRTEES